MHVRAPMYPPVRRVCERYGLKSVGDADHWNLFWTDLSVSVDRVQDVKSFQVHNHLLTCIPYFVTRFLNGFQTGQWYS